MRCEKCLRDFESLHDFADVPGPRLCRECFAAMPPGDRPFDAATSERGSLHPSWRMVALFAVLLFLVCATGWGIYRFLQTEDSIVVVNDDRISIAGEVEIGHDAFGRIRPVIVKEGRLVLFRTDQTIAGGAGRAGEAYRWDDELKLRHVGSFDLALSNDQLYEKYRLETAKQE